MSREPMYPESIAIRCRDGGRYRPSNGTEGMMFQERWCTHCTKDDPEAGMFCPIIAAAMCFKTDEDGYPNEWCYDAQGQPQCTAFESYEDLLEGETP